MKTTLTIIYEWWRDNGKAIINDHIEVLKEDAESQIFEQIQNGYSSGVLGSNIAHKNKDLEYSGAWNLDTSEE